MTSVNPFAKFRSECNGLLRDALTRLWPNVSVPSITFNFPPRPEFGELASSLCFELAKLVNLKPLEVAQRIVGVIDATQFQLLKSVEVAGKGYVNFYVDFANFSAFTIKSARALKTEYGYFETDQRKKIIVEHTSVNPIHPIHIGQARNPILGDALARILSHQGHRITRHYYVNDVGRQTAVIAYGYEKLGRPKPRGKPDHFIGAIYAMTSCITEICRLKKEVEEAKECSRSDEFSKLQTELDEWVSVADDLDRRFPVLFNKLLDEIGKDEDPGSGVSNLIRKYEAGEEEKKQLFREVCQLCIEGFKETLGNAGIFFDSWDWESNFIWNEEVTRVLKRLKATAYVFQSGGVLEFDSEKVAHDLNLKARFGLNENYELPSLTLVRTDGTTLYTTRDISYSLWKFQRAEKVINVVGMEQTLPQLQLKLALCALGYLRFAENLVHFAFNLVSLPGYKMSSRRGRYITLDETMHEAVRRAYEEVSKRSSQLSEEEKRLISDIVGVGAVKYALVEVDPTKPVVFTWDRVLDFEKNSAPYIQYSYARGRSILRKASREPKNPEYSLLTDPLERSIILMLARFPEVFVDAAENLKPNVIADFANELADKFNSFYAALPVISAKPRELSDARLALVDATTIVIKNALSLLGIGTLERM
ncbi:MAG: arginine--tRNA ligase [Candidatus Hodarchaeota archaeon]